MQIYQKCTIMAPLYRNGSLMILPRSHCGTLSLTFPANKDIENFQMSLSLIFQCKESQFLLRIVAEYIGDVIYVSSAPQKLQKKSSVNIFVTGDDRKEPLRYKEPLLHTVIMLSSHSPVN